MKTYQFGDEPLVIHIIKTGFKDLYLCVYEDGWQQMMGNTKILTSSLIKEVFNIDIENESEEESEFKLTEKL